MISTFELVKITTISKPRGPLVDEEEEEEEHVPTPVKDVKDVKDILPPCQLHGMGPERA